MSVLATAINKLKAVKLTRSLRKEKRDAGLFSDRAGSLYRVDRRVFNRWNSFRSNINRRRTDAVGQGLCPQATRELRLPRRFAGWRSVAATHRPDPRRLSADPERRP